MQIIIFSHSGRKRSNIRLGTVGQTLIGLAACILLAGSFYAGVRFTTDRTGALVHSIRERTSSQWQEEIRQQGDVLEETRLEAEKSLDAMSGRLSLLQGNIMRLDALGSRLAEMAGMEDLDFGIDNPPGIGGPAPSGNLQSTDIPDFLRSLGELESRVADRGEKLTAMESMLINSTLQEQTLPGGNPATGGWLSSLYGWRTDPINGKKEFHEGIDFAGRKGTPVAAIAAGIVTWAGPRSDYGNMVEISHGNGYITRYAHNQKNLVTVGEKVDKGEIIAVMGSSGRSTGTHVHFEVIRNGQPVNPKQYLVLN